MWIFALFFKSVLKSALKAYRSWQRLSPPCVQAVSIANIIEACFPWTSSASVFLSLVHSFIVTPPSLSCSSVEWNELNKAIRLGCPCYINRIAEGRRIGLSNAVENPTYVEIGDCYQYLGLPRDIEVRVLFTLCFLTSFIFWCCDFGLNCEFDAPGSCIERTQWG